jgi:flagellar hook-associated protein 1 FlgK
VGDFFGLNLALTALYAQRRGLDVTGQNIANVNTEGYSRQRVSLSAITGASTPAFFARVSGTGGGVKIDGIDRLRDQFLELRGYQEHASQQSLAVTKDTLAKIELVFGEPSDTALSASFADFWGGWADLANHPNDPATRSALVEKGTTLAAGLNDATRQVNALGADALSKLKSVVAEANATAQSIAHLNDAIRNATVSGNPASDLLDQRDLLVSKLSNLVGVTTRPHDDGTVDVFVGSMAMVRDVHSTNLAVDTSGPTVAIDWASAGIPADISSAEAGGLLGVVNGTVPQYLARIKSVSDQLRDDVNAAYTAGVTPPATPFFTNATDGSLVVNPTIVADPSTIIAGAAGAGPLDGNRALQISTLAGPDQAYQTLIVSLGIDAQTTNRRADIQDAVTRQVDAAREATSGVNLDEEMANMVAYQHAYDAAARFMTAIDQTLDTLIHGTGLVGR